MTLKTMIDKTGRIGQVVKIELSPYPMEAKQGIKRAYVVGDGFADWLLPHQYIVHPVMTVYGKKYIVSDLKKRPDFENAPMIFLNTNDPLEAYAVARQLNSTIEVSKVVPSVYPPRPYDDSGYAEARANREGFYRRNPNGIY